VRSRAGLEGRRPPRPRFTCVTQRVATMALLLPFSLTSWTKAAQGKEADGVYGRFDGDLSTSLQAGAHFGLEDCSPRAFIGADAHVYWTLGAYAGYEHGFEREPSHCAQNTGTLGVQLRPLFLLRFVNDWERGPATLDLSLDSLTFGLGGFVQSQEQGRTRGGFELVGSLSLPLVARAPGPWLRGQAGLRFDQGSTLFLRATFAYEWLLLTPLSGRPEPGARRSRLPRARETRRRLPSAQGAKGSAASASPWA
jgi:hypothetical protein